MITVLVSPVQLDASEVEVAADAYRHLFRARRLAVGAELRLADGKGRARWSRVTKVERSSARLQIGEVAPTHEPLTRLELLTPILRPQRLTWLVEKATEVGVVAVRLISSQRAPRRCGERTLERLARVAAAALEQCHRAVLPEITGAHAWQELPTLLEGARQRRMLEPGPSDHQIGSFAETAALIVGPEGGWTDAEKEGLHGLGCRRLGLGPTNLRTETAAIVGSALLLTGAGSR